MSDMKPHRAAGGSVDSKAVTYKIILSNLKRRKKMKKKILATLLCASLAATLLAGCGGSGNDVICLKRCGNHR